MLIGNTTFSVLVPNAPKSSSYKKARELDEESHKKQLFSEERLNLRSKVFIDFSLPLLEKIQEDIPDFIHILHYTSNLPDKYQELLIKAAEKYSFLHLNQYDAYGNSGYAAMERLLNEKMPSSDTQKEIPYGYFRLDDDDLLCSNFGKYFKKYISLAYVGHAISLGYGYFAHYSNEKLFNFRKDYTQFLTCGLGYITSYDLKERKANILNAGYNHIFQDRFLPTISDMTFPSHIVLHTPTADSFRDNGDDPTHKLHESSRNRPFIEDGEVTSNFFSIQTVYEDPVLKVVFANTTDYSSQLNCRIVQDGVYELSFHAEFIENSLSKSELLFEFNIVSQKNTFNNNYLILNQDSKLFEKKITVTPNNINDSFLFKLTDEVLESLNLRMNNNDIQIKKIVISKIS
jgi:hypothetical protein